MSNLRSVRDLVNKSVSGDSCVQVEGTKVVQEVAESKSFKMDTEVIGEMYKFAGESLMDKEMDTILRNMFTVHASANVKDSTIEEVVRPEVSENVLKDLTGVGRLKSTATKVKQPLKTSKKKKAGLNLNSSVFMEIDRELEILNSSRIKPVIK